MISRRHFVAGMSGAGALAAGLGPKAAQAQTVDLLKIFSPAAPGGGWDQTGRSIEAVLRATGAVLIVVLQAVLRTAFRST